MTQGDVRDLVCEHERTDRFRRDQQPRLEHDPEAVTPSFDPGYSRRLGAHLESAYRYVGACRQATEHRGRFGQTRRHHRCRNTHVSAGATFAHHLARRLVGAQALECRRAQLARPGPLDELELSYQLGLHEMGALRRCAPIEWAGVALDRLHQLAELLEHLLCEAGADLARVHEHPLFVKAHEQCAGISAPLALAFQPARDHKLLAHSVPELDPRAAALTRLVRRVERLAHDAFEAGLAPGLTHGRPPSLLLRRGLPGGAF